MKFGYTVIYVEDVPKTVDFYTRAFSFELKFMDETNVFAELQTGNTLLAFSSEVLGQSLGLDMVPNRLGKLSPAVEVAFVTKNIHADFDRAVKEGATAISTPSEKPWGQTVGFLKDLNGVVIELCTPMSDAGDFKV